MSTELQSEFLFIGRGDESFLENYSYELSDDEHGAAGRLFVTLEILENDLEAAEIGEAIFSALKEHFYQDLQKDAYTRFEDALKAVNLIIDQYKGDQPSRFVSNMNVVIAAVCGNELFISQYGDAEAYLVRRRYVSVVSEGLENSKSDETFVNVASGTLQPGDFVLLTSSRLLRYISKTELAQLFSSRELVQSLSEVEAAVSTEILGRIGIAALRVAGAAEEGGAGETTEGGQMFAKSGSGVFRHAAKVGAFFRNVKSKSFDKALNTEALRKLTGGRDLAKDKLLIGLVLVIVVLLGSVFWLRTRGNQDQLVQEQELKLQHVQEVMAEAINVGQFDKDKAAELLQAAEQEALTVLNSRYLRSKAAGILTEIKDQRNLLDNVQYVTEPAITIDLAQKRSSVDILGMTFLRDRLYAFEYNALYEMILDKVQDPLTINDTETVVLGAGFADQNALVFATKSNRMIEYADGIFSFVDTADTVWKRGIDLDAYGQRLYLLDPENNQIWRYTRRRDSYDIAEGYNVDADLSNGVSMAIDGGVYVLNRDGTITKLYTGEKQSFPLRRQPLVPLDSPTRIYTNENLNQLFVLDPNNDRVVVYTKDERNGGALYSTQYVFEHAGQLRDLYVSRDENRLYVADEQKIYVIELGSVTREE